MSVRPFLFPFRPKMNYKRSRHRGTLAPLLFAVVLCVMHASAQQREVRGVVVDAATSTALRGATVVVMSLADSTSNGALTDRRGRFIVRGVAEGRSLLRISYIGFRPSTDTIVIGRTGAVLDTIRLAGDTVRGRMVLVTQTRLRTLQKDDTTEYDAKSFDADPDDDADDLVEQLPGVTVDNGTIRAFGEEVDKVLVDGLTFFGADAMSTLQNLPVDMIDKVQIYDTKSETAQFTGADEQSNTKTINIVTQEDKRSGYFGKGQAGYGLQNRFQGSGSVNRFDSTMRVSVLAMANNVNDQRFAFADVSDATQSAMSFESGGLQVITSDGSMDDLFDADDQGITTTQSVATMFSTGSGPMQLHGSYTIKDRETDASTTLRRQFVTSNDVDKIFQQTDTSTRTSTSHSLRLSGKFTIDSATQVSIGTNLRFNAAQTQSLLQGLTTGGLDTLSTNVSETGAQTRGSSLGADISLRHRFAKPRRYATMDVELLRTVADITRQLTSLGISGDVADAADSINQRGVQDDGQLRARPRLTYSEPLTDRSDLRVMLTAERSTGSSDRRTRRGKFGSDDVSTIDTSLSNAFTQELSEVGTGVDYVWTDSNIRVTAGVEYRSTDLRGSSTFPFTLSNARSFQNVLPKVSLGIMSIKDAYADISYSLVPTLPSLSQMQEVLDNSNPQVLSVGNAQLRQALGHSIQAMYHGNVPSIDGYAFFSGNVRWTSGFIGTQTDIADRDTTIDGINLSQGSQLTRPVNLDGAFSSDAMLFLGFRVDTLPLRVSINFNLQYAQTPGIVNTLRNEATSLSAQGSLDVDYDLTDAVSLGAGVFYRGGSVDNTLQTDIDNAFSTALYRANISWKLWKGFRLSADMSSQQLGGLSNGFNRNITLLNIALKQSLFANDRGQIQLSIRDALNQANDVNRQFTDSFTEDRITMLLRRVVLLTFSYRFRAIGE